MPWLRVQDVPSRGRSHKIPGVKVERLHHLLSDLERAYLLVCEFSEDVVDIREQYPLLPVESTQAIARAIGVRYPKYKATTLPLVMTTDFLLTVKQPSGDFKTVARTIKYGVWGATEQKVHLSPAISSQHHNLGPSQLHPLLDSVPKYGSRVESWAENPRGDCRYEIPKTAADSWFDSAVIHRMGRERGRSSA